jgi:hypothetical protein
MKILQHLVGFRRPVQSTSGFVTAFILATVTLASASARAGEFLISLEGRTPIEGMICDDFAYSEGQRLKTFLGTSVAGFELVDSRCYQDEGSNNTPRWNIHISYRAEQPLALVDTDAKYRLNRAGYDEQKACEDVLADQNLIFKRTTGLPIFASTCKIPASRGSRVALSIIGFGNPAVRPYSASFNIFGLISDLNAGSFTAMVRNRLAANNMELAQFGMINRLGYYTYVFRYYGKSELNLADQKIATFANSEQCLSQTNLVHSALSTIGVPDFAVICVKSPFQDSSSVELTAIIDQSTSFTTVNPETQYPTYAACELEKASVIRHYHDQLGRNIVTGFCSQTANGQAFSVVMIEK